MTTRLNIMVILLDGPCAGVITYTAPLPTILVVPVKTVDGPRWHDYERISDTSEYRHAQNCKCHAEA